MPLINIDIFKLLIIATVGLLITLIRLSNTCRGRCPGTEFKEHVGFLGVGGRRQAQSWGSRVPSNWPHALDLGHVALWPWPPNISRGRGKSEPAGRCTHRRLPLCLALLYTFAHRTCTAEMILFQERDNKQQWVMRLSCKSVLCCQAGNGTCCACRIAQGGLNRIEEAMRMFVISSHSKILSRIE